MQITNTPQTNSISSDHGASPQANKSNPRQAGQDSVQLSSLASHFSADSSKLSRLQAAYDAGTYNVSPTQIAHSMISDALSH
jgi:anti-sigma28 factor (negative regulator of flagellin synthesis)